MPAWLKNWQGDGIIARVESRAIEKAIVTTGRPAVDVRGRYDLAMPLVETNDRLVAEMAADHLIDHGFRHFAYCGFAGVNYSLRRLKYLPAYLAERGYDCLVYPPDSQSGRGDQRTREGHGIIFEDELACWVGIAAAADRRHGLQ